MITKIKYVKKFGSFSGFEWDKEVVDGKGNVEQFKSQNIIYGRNYSGKTTLSRVVRSYGLQQQHEDYPGGEYCVCDSECGELRECHVTNSNILIRVYNADFVRENLGFLRDKMGTIQSFAVVGERNVDIDNEIARLKDEIGDNQGGLVLSLHCAMDKHASICEKLQSEKTHLDNQLIATARNIKNHVDLYGEINYDKRRLQNEADAVGDDIKCLLDSEVTKLETLVREKAKDSIAAISVKQTKYRELREKSNALLKTVVRPSKSIQKLLDNPELQGWVKQGASLHRQEKECGFCGGELTDNFWDRLDAHFSKESGILTEQIDKMIADIECEHRLYSSFIAVDAHLFYCEIKENVDNVCDSISALCSEYCSVLDLFKKALEEKRFNVFADVEYDFIGWDEKGFADAQYELNRLIAQNNEITLLMNDKKADAQKTLRLRKVFEFVNEVYYVDCKRSIKSLEERAKEAETAVNDNKNKIRLKEREIHALEAELKDESRGAIAVNSILNHFFGHDALRLEVQDDSYGARFVLKRGNATAENLSEGECSLVAFCYFIAKLEELGDDLQRTIIWIDDPVSSLDVGHLYFIYSLIEAKIVKDKLYSQFFISTHNLDFLKYIKRLSKGKKEERNFFMVEKNGSRSSIKPMPSYLKKYITEFNYLFGVIYQCAHQACVNDDYNYYYNFGNNVRKFLESFLFFKYPHDKAIKDKLYKFFGGDVVSTNVVRRLDNELSHLEEMFDRGVTPLDIPEMTDVAKYILSRIESADKEQYDALVESIS